MIDKLLKISNITQFKLVCRIHKKLFYFINYLIKEPIKLLGLNSYKKYFFNFLTREQFPSNTYMLKKKKKNADYSNLMFLL